MKGLRIRIILWEKETFDIIAQEANIVIRSAGAQTAGRPDALHGVGELLAFFPNSVQ